MKRIAVLFEFTTLNGGEQSMLACFDELAGRSGIQFVAIAPEQGNLAAVLKQRKIEHVQLRLRDEHDQRLPREQIVQNLRDVIAAVNPDLVHANSLSTGRLLGAAAEKLSVPTTAHLRDIIKLSKAAIADLNRNVRLVAVSDATRDFHIQQGLDAEKCVRIYNGADTKMFQPRPRTGFLHNELGLSEDAILVGNIGQIGLRKGQDTLTRVATTHLADSELIHYLLIGERHSNKQESIEFERNIQRMFDDAEMNDRLHWLGFRHDIPQIMNELHLLVHCAKQEPFGRVLLEAAASELPIVATDVGGTREMLRSGKEAILIPANSDTALLKATCDILNSADLRQSLAQNARKRMVESFMIQEAANHLCALWKSLLNRQTPFSELGTG